VTRADLIGWIGWSHLLQPPLTLLLASPRGLHLRAALQTSTALAGAVAHNMAVASVVLPTGLGVLLAYRAPSVAALGTTRDLAFLLAAFWSWRLYRQLFVIGPTWPAPRRALHVLLSCIFTVQGPLLAALSW
jgi:hypothetical protein